MKDDLVVSTQKILSNLYSFLANTTSTYPVTGKGGAQEVEISFPFLMFDDRPLLLRLRREKDKVILHDNSWLYQYLLAYGLNIIDDRGGSNKKFLDLMNRIVQNKGFNLSTSLAQFRLVVDEKNPKQVYDFVDSLIAISYLALGKKAGTNQLTWRDLNRFKDLRGQLQVELKDSHIKSGIRIPELRWTNMWGMLVEKENAGPVALQFLGGESDQKVGVNMMISKSVLEAEQRWLHVDRSNCILVYGGKAEFFNQTREAMEQLADGTGLGGYPMIPWNQKDELVEFVKSRLQDNGRKKSADLYSGLGNLLNEEPRHNMQTSVLDEIVDQNLASLKKAEALNQDVSFRIACELYVDGPRGQDYVWSVYGPSSLKGCSLLFDAEIVRHGDNGEMSLTEEGYNLIQKIESQFPRKLSEFR